MRKIEKQVSDPAMIDAIIGRADVIRIAMVKDNRPYLVPLNFGYDGKSFYIHSAKQGKKLDIIKENPNVWFELTGKHAIVPSPYGCEWTCKYECVMGEGKAEILTDSQQKRHALDVIMEKYSPDKKYDYSDKSVDNVCMVKIDIENMIGKSDKEI